MAERNSAEKSGGRYGYCPNCGSGALMKGGKTDSTKRQRYRCGSCGKRTSDPHPTPGYIEPASEFQSTLPDSQIYIITAAQNATPIHKPFWSALQNLAEFYGAKIIVSGYRYKNPTSQWTERQQAQERWDEELEPYLYQTRQIITENLEFLGDVFTQATAVSPVTGFETMTGEHSCILPGPKVQLRTIATPAHKYPKIITTTGSVTVENYTKTKTGKAGEFHHTFGAVVVEKLPNGVATMRQISAQKNGAFYDVSKQHGVIKVDADGVTKGHKLAGLVMGDTHVDFVDPGVVAATFENDDSICNVGDPNWLVWHDLIDLYSRNRHCGNPFIEVAKGRDNTDDVYEELVRGWRFHDEMARGKKSAIVPSNHTNGRLDWYMQNVDWRQDPKNAEFYLETALQMVRSLRTTDSGHAYDDPFTYWGKKLSKAKNIQFLEYDKSFKIAGIECQYHGHVGPGAARSASLSNMRRIGTKSVFAHTHEPGTEEGAMTAGTSTRLRLGYNAGPSSWMNSHVAIYPNGKRSHLFIFDGQW